MTDFDSPNSAAGAAVPSTERHGILLRWGSWRALLAALCLLLLVGEVGARMLVSQLPDDVDWYDESTELRIAAIEDHGGASIVFAGTSMAWQAFEPGVFDEVLAPDRPSFNVGLAGATPVVMEPWLLDEIDARMEPELVIWGLSSLDFAPNYGERQLASYESAPATRPGVAGHLDRWLSSFSVLADRRSGFTRPSDTFGVEASEQEQRWNEAHAALGPAGQRQVWQVDKSQRRADIQRARLRGFRLDRADVESIARTVLELQERGIEVVFVALPVSPSFVNQHPGDKAAIALVTTAIEDLGSELGVRVVDESDGYREADFVDFTHLTEVAATRFSEVVARELSE